MRTLAIVSAGVDLSASAEGTPSPRRVFGGEHPLARGETIRRPHAAVTVMLVAKVGPPHSDALAFGTAHSSSRCSTDRKCTSDWFDREHSHVRDVL